MFRQVPVLPVVIPLALVVFGVEVWPLRRRHRLRPLPVAVAVVGSVYVAGVVANTVFPIYLDKPQFEAPWDAHLNLIPFQGYEMADAVMNIVVFLPVGVLLPLVLADGSWRRVIAAGAALSLIIETTQLVTAHTLGGGHIADINDFAFNVVGAALGWVLLTTALRIPVVGTTLNNLRTNQALRSQRAPSQ